MMKISVVAASDAFGKDFEGEAFRLEGEDAEVLSRARALGWHGDRSPLHTPMADLAKLVRIDCSDVAPEVRTAIIKAERAIEKSNGRPREMRLVSHLERDGEGFVRVYTMRNGASPARAAGFDTDGLRWSTTNPAVAMKLVEHYAQTPELAIHIRVAAATIVSKKVPADANLMRLTVVPAAEAFGGDAQGDAYRLECPPEAIPLALGLGWIGDTSPLHAVLPDTAAKTIEFDDVTVSNEVRLDIEDAVRRYMADEMKARSKTKCQLVSTLERDGRVYYLLCGYDDREIAKDAGFRWNGRAWWTDRPSTALKLVEYAATPAVAAELRAVTKALPPILKPTSDPVSNLVCDIRMVGQEIRADFPAKHDDFLATIRTARFHWTGSHWIRTVTARMGSVPDRMADIAHALLEKDFLVRVHDAEAQAKAISGDFEAEETRWVSVAAGTGRWDGWYALTWRKSDDLYEVANTIPGARWSGKMLVVPPGSHEEIADFAERYDFCITPGAEEIGEQQRAAIIGAITVAPAKRKAKPAAAKRRPKIKVVEAAIDDELLDEGHEQPEVAMEPEPKLATAHDPVEKPAPAPISRARWISAEGIDRTPPHLWDRLYGQEGAAKEATDRALVASVFGVTDVPAQFLPRAAAVAGIWHAAKYVEMESCAQYAVACPPEVHVITPWGEAMDVAPYLPTTVTEDGGRTTWTFQAPAFAKETGFHTDITRFGPSGRVSKASLVVSPDGNVHDPFVMRHAPMAPRKEAA